MSVKVGKLLFLKTEAGITASGRPMLQATITRNDGARHQFAIADRGGGISSPLKKYQQKSHPL